MFFFVLLLVLPLVEARRRSVVGVVDDVDSNGDGFDCGGINGVTDRVVVCMAQVSLGRSISDSLHFTNEKRKNPQS
jgi:hypothetical protein